MSSKRQKSTKRPSHRKGLSGNPQRRAIQLGQVKGTPEDASALLALARTLAGAGEPAPWWAGTHERILARTRSLTWPSSTRDLEELTCQVVGDELFDQLEQHDTGVRLIEWLQALIKAAGKAACDAVASGSADWPQLWALQRGLTLTTLSEPPSDTAAEFFPELEDPLESARGEAEKTAVMLAERGLRDSSATLAPGALPAGEPLLASDEYGSRFLLAAPFGYSVGGEVDHWYAWDIDMCWLGMQLHAGAFDSAQDALKEWSDAVGPAADGAALAPCQETMIPSLLHDALGTGFAAHILRGGEPRPLIREYFRLRRRAREVAALLADGLKKVEPSLAVEEFGKWYRDRHPGTAEAIGDATEIIAEHWGAYWCPDERVFRACSPHRIRQCAILIRDQHYADSANPALRLLPEWTQWCIEATGLSGRAAERALLAATAEASYLVDEAARNPARRVEDTDPFRLQE